MNRTLILLLALTFALIGNDAIEAKTYYVRKSGNDNNNGTSTRSAFQTIGQAAKIASPGDYVIIGSGSYVESIFWDKRPQGNQSCVFLGDPDGFLTGDKGGVTWLPQGIIAFSAQDSCGLYIENIDFRANPAVTTTQTAIKFYRNLGTCWAYNCTFTNFYNGIQNYAGYATCYAYQCKFSNVIYGVNLDKGNGTELFVVECDIATTRFGVATAGAKAVYIANSTISAYNGVGNVKGVDATGCFLVVSDTTVSGTWVGVRGTNVSFASINRCIFDKNTLYSTDLTGENLSIENTSFNDCYYGVRATETNGNWIYLDQVQFNGNFRGVASDSGNYWCTNTTFTDCTTGWYMLSASNDVTIASDGSLSFKNCTEGIKASKAANVEPTLYVDSVIFEGCMNGINAGSVSTSISKCKFVCKTYGFYAYNSPQTKISNCVFRGESDSNRTNYGCYARSERTNISDTRAELCKTGMYIYNLTDTSPVVQNVNINDCTGDGLTVHNGFYKWTGNDSLVITNCSRGLAYYDGQFIADGVTHGDTCGWGLFLYRTNSTIANCNLTGDSMAVYQYLGDTISMSGSTLHDCSSYGMYVHTGKNVKYTDCTLTRCSHGAIVYTTAETTQLEMSGITAVDNSSCGIYMHNAHAVGSIKDSKFENNKYGILANTSPLDFDGEDNVSITGNYYGIYLQNSEAKLANMAINGNQYGVYVNYGNVDIVNCDLDNESYGIYIYATAECNIDNCRINGGSTGIIISPKEDYEGVTSVTRTQISGATTGLNYQSDPKYPNASLRIADCSFQNLANGLTATNTQVSVFNLIAEDIKGNGISFKYCDAQVSNSRMLRCGSCGFYGLSNTVTLDRVQIGQAGSYAISSTDNKIVLSNSLVHDNNYACSFSGQSDDSQVVLLQSTFANNNSYAVTITRGQGTVTNCIMHSRGTSAFYLGTNRNVSHSNNVIYAEKSTSSTPAAFQGEIVKDPLFVNAAASDFRLQSASPAINAGIELAGINSTDWDGNQRPSFKGYEIGAFEYMKPSGSLRVLAWEEMARQD